MIACAKLILGLIVPVVFALLLNELKSKRFVKITQTLVYLPNFLSWVILDGIFATLLSPGGLINHILEMLGLGNYYFMGDNSLFPGVLIVTDIWKTSATHPLSIWLRSRASIPGFMKRLRLTVRENSGS